MKYLAFILIPVIVSHVLLTIKNHNIKMESKEQNRQFCVRLPKAFFVIAFTALVFCYVAALAMVFTLKGNSIVFIICFSVMLLFSLLALALLTASVVFRIDVDKNKDYFDYYTSFGHHYTVKYLDCSFKLTENALTLYANKTFIVDPYSVNFNHFVSLINERCKRHE